MAITPPIMTYPLGTDYYDVEIFNTNWKNSLTYLDNNFLNDERVLSEQLSTSTTNVLSTEASNKLFENGVGTDVLGYIEDGGTHTAGTVWLSKYNKGEFKCLETNIDDFINTNKWLPIDDNSNASKLQNLMTISGINLITTPQLLPGNYVTTSVFDTYSDSTLIRIISPNSTSTTFGVAEVRTSMICSIADLKIGITMRIKLSSNNARGLGPYYTWKLSNGKLYNTTTNIDGSGFTDPAIIIIETIKII